MLNNNEEYKNKNKNVTQSKSNHYHRATAPSTIRKLH